MSSVLMLPVQSAEMLLQVASGRRRNAMVGWTVLFLSVLTGGAMLIFFRKTFIFLFCLLVFGMTRTPKASCSIFSGLPYGKTAPVLMAKKPAWQIMLNPPPPEISELWTGLVSAKSISARTTGEIYSGLMSAKSAHRMQFIGRVRMLLVGETWLIQTVADPKLACNVDVRQPAVSPLWRTYYTCPASKDSALPPPSSEGNWKYVGPGAGTGGQKKADNATLRLEVEPGGNAATSTAVREWFARRRKGGLPPDLKKLVAEEKKKKKK